MRRIQKFEELHVTDKYRNTYTMREPNYERFARKVDASKYN